MIDDYRYDDIWASSFRHMVDESPDSDTRVFLRGKRQKVKSRRQLARQPRSAVKSVLKSVTLQTSRQRQGR